MSETSQGSDTPREVALQFMELVTSGMINGSPETLRNAVDLFADDSTLWLIGTLPFSGTLRGRKEILDKMYLPSLDRMASGTMTWQLRTVVAEGEHVVVEWTSQRKTPDGRDYENFLIALFHVRNGKIVSMREYLDTQRAKEAYWPETKVLEAG